MAPVGVGWLLPHLPISESLMTFAVTQLIIVCVTGLLGFLTRTSALLALIASLVESWVLCLALGREIRLGLLSESERSGSSMFDSIRASEVRRSFTATA